MFAARNRIAGFRWNDARNARPVHRAGVRGRGSVAAAQQAPCRKAVACRGSWLSLSAICSPRSPPPVSWKEDGRLSSAASLPQEQWLSRNASGPHWAPASPRQLCRRSGFEHAARTDTVAGRHCHFEPLGDHQQRPSGQPLANSGPDLLFETLPRTGHQAGTSARPRSASQFLRCTAGDDVSESCTAAPVAGGNAVSEGKDVRHEVGIARPTQD
jgi:hypothetical protein